MTTSQDAPYQPIDCDQHSKLELLAMRRAQVTVQLSDAAGHARVLQGSVCDVRTRDGAEYLVIRTADGDEQALRLDHLRALYDRDAKPIWRQKNVGD